MQTTTPMKTIAIDLEVNRVIENARVSFDESENDILRRELGLNASASPVRGPINAATPPVPRSRSQRTPGSYGFTLNGNSSAYSSLKEAYREILLELARRDGEFLNNLSREDTRARRIVSKDAASLYKNNPRLADDYAEKLAGDWWYDTNLSQDQVESRLAIACKVARIEFGKGLELDFPED